jgi:mono/diheme cytochrome c family protein
MEIKQILLISAVIGFASQIAALEPTKVDYASQIKPILAKNCISCHGVEKQKGGLRLDAGASILRGGNSGPILIPGKSNESKILHAVEGKDPETRMPPEPKALISKEQAVLLAAWVDQGAFISKQDLAASEVVKKTRSTHWSFQPIVKPVIPLDNSSGWARAPLDVFIYEQMRKEGLNPAKEADELGLLRRVYLDITGIPPSYLEVDAFLNDKLPGAYERAVDRALASPRYGEKWGRFWLDLARYADSDGYEKDTGRPFAWRYRQWVIDALNADMPFDQFTIEQLAGDLLKNSSADQKAATGFHRNTLTNKEGGVDQEQFRVEAVVDRANTTAKVFLGLTLGCAQCHDHKYDPISQREYYQFFAFFNSDTEVNIAAAPLPGEQDLFAQKLKEHQSKVDQSKGALDLRKKELGKDVDEWAAKLKPDTLPGKLKTVLDIDASKRTAVQKNELINYRASLDEKAKGIQKQIADLGKSAPTPTMAQALALGKERKTNIHIRGDFLRKGVEVDPETPAVLPATITKQKLGRLELAQWITDKENPLTRRVIANWVWHKFFGRGIVTTLEDFGTQGEKPSNPQLLDYLASSLSDNNWSLKSLHRLIVTSAVYRQSSVVEPANLKKDPYNVFLSRQSRVRLDAEGVRDVFLSASGLVDQRIGGQSVRPPQPPGISELTYANAVKWNESKGLDRYRRGLYIWFQRTSPYPTLMLFDAPDSNLACVRRERSNTPLQALALMNDVAFYECAKSLGLSLANPDIPLEGNIRRAFASCLSRFPSERETVQMKSLFDGFKKHYELNSDQARQVLGNGTDIKGDVALSAAWVAFARVLLNLDEIIVRD